MDTTSVEEMAHEARLRLKDRAMQAKERLGSIADGMVTFMKEHPASSLIGAFALGYLVARAARHG